MPCNIIDFRLIPCDTIGIAQDKYVIRLGIENKVAWHYSIYPKVPMPRTTFTNLISAIFSNEICQVEAIIPGEGGSSDGSQARRNNEDGSTSGGSGTTYTSDSYPAVGHANDTSTVFGSTGGGPHSEWNCSLSCELAQALEIASIEEFPLCAVNAEPYLRQASFAFYEVAMSTHVAWSDQLRLLTFHYIIGEERLRWSDMLRVDMATTFLARALATAKDCENNHVEIIRDEMRMTLNNMWGFDLRYMILKPACDFDDKFDLPLLD